MSQCRQESLRGAYHSRMSAICDVVVAGYGASFAVISSPALRPLCFPFGFLGSTPEESYRLHVSW